MKPPMTTPGAFQPWKRSIVFRKSSYDLPQTVIGYRIKLLRISTSDRIVPSDAVVFPAFCGTWADQNRIDMIVIGGTISGMGLHVKVSVRYGPVRNGGGPR
jgi:hypothetical protein